MERDKDQVFLEMTLRQLAPHIANTFNRYTHIFQTEFYNLYLVIRYEPGQPLGDPESTRVEIRALKQENKEQIAYDLAKDPQSSEATMLKGFFPVFQGETVKHAAIAGVQPHDVFLTMSYKRGSADLDTADSMVLQWRARGTNYVANV